MSAFRTFPSTNGTQHDRFGIARFEAYGCTCGDIESLVDCLDTIGGKCLVRLHEVVVRANLDWTVALVGDFEFDAVTSPVDNDAFLLRDDGAREVQGIYERKEMRRGDRQKRAV